MHISPLQTWLKIVQILLLGGLLSACLGSGGSDNAPTDTTTAASTKLTSLSLAAADLTPPFSADQHQYQVTVSSTYISIIGVTKSPDASFTINHMTGNNGQASLVGLQPGENIIDVVVSHRDAPDRTYRIIANRVSSNANLLELNLLGGEITPSFSSDQLNYSATVPYGTDSVYINARLSDQNASLSINGTDTASTVDSNISLSIGENTIPVVVTAEDNSTKTYNLTITRAAPIQTASLSAVQLSSGTLNPTFSPDTFSYSVALPYSTSSIDLTATLSDALASMTVNATALASGGSRTLTLAIGSNPVEIIVSESDGSSKTYQININRASASSNTQLSAITLSQGTLSPVFDSANYSYETRVPYSAGNVTVSAVKSEALSTLQINAATVSSKSIVLNVGSNIVNLKVTAEDSSSATYRINIIRELAATDATLSSLTFSPGALSPAFNSTIYNYSALLPYTSSSITVNANVSDNNYSGMTINGALATSGVTSDAINLTQGANTITVVVTAEDGSTQKTYSINITREAPFARGINLSNTANTILSADNVAEWASWGVNTVRIHLNKDDNSNAYTNPPTASDIWAPYTASKARMEQWITWCANNNIKVIVTLDLLWGDDHGSTAMWNNGGSNDYLQHRIDLAAAAAQWLAGFSNVTSLEVWNEPHPYDNLYVSYFLPAVIPAIRAVNTDIQIIVMSPWDWGLPQGLYSWNGVDNADGNLIYSTHIYNPWTYTHQTISGNPVDYEGWPGYHKDYPTSSLTYYDSAWVNGRVALLKDFETRSGSKVMITEFGVLRWAIDNEKYLQDWITAFEANNMEWIFHGIGGWNGWNPTFDASAAQTFEPDGNIDTPELQLLQSYWQQNNVQ